MWMRVGTKLVSAHNLLGKFDLGADWFSIPRDFIEWGYSGKSHLQSRQMSEYGLSTGVKIWVITEADRSSTCILLPEEY
jgi:hypothetical protein